MLDNKSFNNYDQRNDYANGEEIMIMITLAEYRELIRCNEQLRCTLRGKEAELYDLRNGEITSAD